MQLTCMASPSHYTSRPVNALLYCSRSLQCLVYSSSAAFWCCQNTPPKHCNEAICCLTTISILNQVRHWFLKICLYFNTFNSLLKAYKSSNSCLLYEIYFVYKFGGCISQEKRGVIFPEVIFSPAKSQHFYFLAVFLGHFLEQENKVILYFHKINSIFHLFLK